MTAETRTFEGLARAARELLRHVTDAPSTSISTLAYDSRQVRSGTLFFCVPGGHHDGHEFASDAVTRGAAGLVVEHSVGLGVPEIVVTDARRAMARMAAAFYGNPARGLLLLGVTGTNGKTTTTYLLRSILEAAGPRTGMIGTVETRIGDEIERGVRTTPESVDLQALFARMREASVEAVAMEVTSHALVQHRVEDVMFDVAAFTNLSQDHLDFHSGIEDYFAAKRSLFEPERARTAVYNVDDEYGRRLLEAAPVPALGFGVTPDADVRASRVRAHGAGTEMTVAYPGGELELYTPMVGDFNVSNCLAACAASLQAKLPPDAIRAGIAALRSVPGRFEPVTVGQPFTVVVDYSHTPDSLDNALREGRRFAERNNGRVLCVFGCGGDRDRGKRPLMGALGARLADVLVVTSDNPRSEEPESIIGEILEGVLAERAEGADAILPDRREAIFFTLSKARPGDIVVIAGKGHETGQEFATETIPFDDRVVAREALASLGWVRQAAETSDPSDSARHGVIR